MEETNAEEESKSLRSWASSVKRTRARLRHWSRSCVTCRCGEREELLNWRELNQTKVQANPSLTIKLANTNPNSHPKFQIKIPLPSGCTAAAQRGNQAPSSEFPLVQRKVSQCVCCQFSGGGGVNGDDASLRRRRRLSSAALGSPSSSAAAPSSVVCLSVSKETAPSSAAWGSSAGEDKRRSLARWRSAMRPWLTCFVYSQLGASSWRWTSVLLPTTGEEWMWLVLTSGPPSARGGLNSTADGQWRFQTFNQIV